MKSLKNGRKSSRKEWKVLSNMIQYHENRVLKRGGRNEKFPDFVSFEIFRPECIFVIDYTSKKSHSAEKSEITL